MAIAVCINANAQNWQIYHNQADELKGTNEHYTNVYKNVNGDYAVCWSNSNNLKIVTDSGIFDYFYSASGFSAICNNTMIALVGYYKDGVLIEKESISFYVPVGDRDTAYPYLKNKGTKIIRHLKYVGDVRIIAPKYSGADFDITIPMNTNIVTNIVNYNTALEPTDSNINDLEEKYHNIEDIISINKKQMRKISKDSEEYKTLKEQNKVLRERMDEINDVYFDITGKNIYDTYTHDS